MFGPGLDGSGKPPSAPSRRSDGDERAVERRRPAWSGRGDIHVGEPVRDQTLGRIEQMLYFVVENPAAIANRSGIRRGDRGVALQT